jgi:hypothetical protein
MRTTVILVGLLVACFGYAGAAPAFGQEQEEVRGAFLTTRPKPVEQSKSGATARPSRRRPKTIATRPPTSSSDPLPATGGKTSASRSAKATAQRIGLGLTLFTRDSNGLAVRVDPSHEFRKGDRVRLLLETNTAGYLYIFNTTDGGQPVLIYPDADLEEAGNFIQAHVPVELPSSLAGEERLRWLAFDEHAGAERLFFVFTREPLSAVPIEDDLINYCREKTSNCPWHPGSELWAQIQKGLDAPVQVAKVQRFGNAQTSGEHAATTRGIGLSKRDPEPSLIMLTASSHTDMLVTTLDLIHK